MARNIAIKVARAEKDIKLCRAICRVLGKTLDELFWIDEEPGSSDGNSERR